MSMAEMRFTAPDSTPGVLGKPIHVHYGEFHIGTLDPVPVSRGGTEIRIQYYKPCAPARETRLRIGRVVLVELVAYIAAHFSSITVVSFVLGRDIEDHGDGLRLAGTRCALLQSMGAEHIVITPRPDSRVGHFVVEAVWQYNQANLATLAAAIRTERAAYCEREAAAASERRPRAGARLRKFISRTARRGRKGKPSR